MSISLSGSLLLTGSLTVTGEITMSGSIASASYATTASYALTASYVEGGGSSVMVADTGTCSTVRCGVSNCASGNYSFVGGGASGSAAACHSFIGGGIGNKICSTATCASIVGGYCNTISAYAYYSTIGGGYCNTLSNNYSFIGNGSLNTVSGLKSAIVTGAGNVVCGYNSFIGSGTLNTISLCGCHSSIGGGHSNTVSGKYSFVGSGRSNSASGKYSAIVGGNANCACGCNSFIGGGYSNFTVTCFSVVGGGYNNVVFGCHSFVGSGRTNVVCGAYSGVLSGCNNTVTGTNSFVLGSNISGSANDTTYINNLVANGTTQQLTGSVTITGSLQVNGVTPLYIDQTSSLSVASASYAATASYVLNAVTSSYVNALSQSLLVTGSVGIGTSSPFTILDVKQSATGSATVNSAFRDSSTNGNALQIWNGNNEARFRAIYYDTPSDQNITFWTITSAGSEGERMRITSAGNVGIGTNSPSYRLDVHVGGTATQRLRNNAAGGTATLLLETANTFSGTSQAYVQCIGNAGGGQSQLAFATAGASGDSSATERVRITNSGNVGIGLTSPTGQLSIINQVNNGSDPVSSYAATSGVSGQNFFNGYYAVNSDGSGTFPRYFDIVSVGSPDGSNGGSNIRFFTNPITNNSPSVERARFTSNGYLRLAGNGIQFNGDTADANSLDDYEEGTWTPVLAASSGAAGYNAQLGWYTKVGRVVTITWFIDFTKNTLSGGTLRLTNFPFSLLNGGAFYPQGVVLLDNLSTTTNNITLQGANNSTGGDFIAGNGSTASHTGLPITSLGSGSMNCRGVLTYFT